MYSSMVASRPAKASRWGDLLALAFFVVYLAGASMPRPKVERAVWFPDKPRQVAYEWRYAPCSGCVPIEPQRDWLEMQRLAGLTQVHFLRVPDNILGDAYSYAPNALVLSTSALHLPRCQLDFIVGHELVHLAMHDFDEDAHSASVLSGLSPSWTRNGRRALSLLDGDYGLALRMGPIWQGQERRADWVGALLAAEGGGCTLQEGALSYFREQSGYGGGIGAAHQADAERLRFLAGFAEPAARLAARW